MSSRSDKKKKAVAAPHAAAPVVWTRLTAEAGVAYNVLNREVNEEEVQLLLKERWDAKLDKDYKIADEKAAALRDMRIAYHDENKTWQTLSLTTVKLVTDSGASMNRKRSKRQERNRRQARKNRRKQAGHSNDGDSDDGGSGNESEGEPAPVQKKKKRE